MCIRDSASHRASFAKRSSTSRPRLSARSVFFTRNSSGSAFTARQRENHRFLIFVTGERLSPFAADDVICLEQHEFFYAIGAYYADFSQVSDEEVIDILKRFPVQRLKDAKQPAA